MRLARILNSLTRLPVTHDTINARTGSSRIRVETGADGEVRGTTASRVF